MKRKELERIGKELKEKYFEIGIKEMSEQLRDDYRYTYKLGREMLRSFDYSHLSEEEKEKRLLNNYTDEEIEEIVSKINMSDNNYNEYLNQFNPDYMSNCSTVTDFGFDIENVCGDLRMQDYEYVRILMFDESLKYIGTLEHTDHKKYSVSAYGVDEGIKDYPECRYVITLHNHPHNLCANTDDKDTWLYNKHKSEYKNKYNVEIIDDCIVSEYDFYSRKQKDGTI